MVFSVQQHIYIYTSCSKLLVCQLLVWCHEWNIKGKISFLVSLWSDHFYPRKRLGQRKQADVADGNSNGDRKRKSQVLEEHPVESWQWWSK